MPKMNSFPEDLEELLEDDGVVAGKSSTRSGKVALALLSATALLGLSVVAVTKVQKLRNVSGDLDRYSPED